MDIQLKAGLSCEVSLAVEEKHTAKALASGLAEVFATPALIALMENAAYLCVQSALPLGTSTVGSEICAKHLAATPVGLKVTARATLTAAEGRKLTFDIEAFDEAEKIGEATHVRYVIDQEKFLKKAYAKAKA